MFNKRLSGVTGGVWFVETADFHGVNTPTMTSTAISSYQLFKQLALKNSWNFHNQL